MVLKIPPLKKKTYDLCPCGKQIETRCYGKVGVCPKCRRKKVLCMVCYQSFWIAAGAKLICPYCQVPGITFLQNRRPRPTHKRIVICRN